MTGLDWVLRLPDILTTTRIESAIVASFRSRFKFTETSASLEAPGTVNNKKNNVNIVSRFIQILDYYLTNPSRMIPRVVSPPGSSIAANATGLP